MIRLTCGCGAYVPAEPRHGSHVRCKRHGRVRYNRWPNHWSAVCGTCVSLYGPNNAADVVRMLASHLILHKGHTGTLFYPSNTPESMLTRLIDGTFQVLKKPI